MADEPRTVKPSGPTGPSSKGAEVSGQMGPAHSPSGPNETDGDPSGVIPPVAIEPPGEDQVGLVGGDVGVPQTSQTGNPNWKEEPWTRPRPSVMRGRRINQRRNSSIALAALQTPGSV
jgi:hypothetical protein